MGQVGLTLALPGPSAPLVVLRGFHGGGSSCCRTRASVVAAAGLSSCGSWTQAQVFFQKLRHTAA